VPFTKGRFLEADPERAWGCLQDRLVHDKANPLGDSAVSFLGIVIEGDVEIDEAVVKADGGKAGG